MEKIPLYLFSPVAINVKRALPEVIKSELWQINPIQKNDSELVEKIYYSQPCVCLFSVVDQQSAKDIVKFMHKFKEFLVSNKYEEKDQKINFIVVTEDSSVAVDRWLTITIHEIIFAPFTPKSFEFKLTRHYEKLSNQTEAVVKTKEEPVRIIKNITLNISDKLNLIKEESIDKKQIIYKIEADSEKKNNKNLYVVEVNLKNVEPSSGKWIKINQNKNGNDKDKWTWKSNKTEVQELEYFVDGIEPTYDQNNKCWNIIGTTLNLEYAEPKPPPFLKIIHTENGNIVVEKKSLEKAAEIKNVFVYQKGETDSELTKSQLRTNHLDKENKDNLKKLEIVKNEIEVGLQNVKHNENKPSNKSQEVKMDKSSDESVTNEFLNIYGISKNDSIEEVLSKIRNQSETIEKKNHNKINAEENLSKVNAVISRDSNNVTTANVSGTNEALIENSKSFSRIELSKKNEIAEQKKYSVSDKEKNKITKSANSNEGEKGINQNLLSANEDNKSLKQAKISSGYKAKNNPVELNDTKIQNTENESTVQSNANNRPTNSHLYNSVNNDSEKENKYSSDLKADVNLKIQQNQNLEDKNIIIKNGETVQGGWSQQFSDSDLVKRADKELKHYYNQQNNISDSNLASNSDINSKFKKAHANEVELPYATSTEDNFFKKIIKKIKSIFQK